MANPNRCVIDTNNLSEFLAVNSIKGAIDLGNGKTIVSIPAVRDPNNDLTNMNVSIAIAAAITAYARMHMTPLLQDSNYNVYYTDTDSIFTDKPLTESYIGKGLGQLKLEYII